MEESSSIKEFYFSYKAIQPYQEIARQHNVGFMIGEFGIFANADWDIDIVTSYYDTMMALFEEKGLGWCFCELYNSGTHLLLREGVRSQWTNATEFLNSCNREGIADGLAGVFCCPGAACGREGTLRPVGAGGGTKSAAGHEPDSIFGG